MFGRLPKNAAPLLGTRPNISESHSEISTQVPFCIAAGLRGGAPLWLCAAGGAHVVPQAAARPGLLLRHQGGRLRRGLTELPALGAEGAGAGPVLRAGG